MQRKFSVDPLGPTRQVGQRGTFKPVSVIRLKKSPNPLYVESALEVLLAKLADLSNAVTLIDYQPFTVDVANKRVLLTHIELQYHRQNLNQVGMHGVFYTPDLRFRWQISKGAYIDEVLEAKDTHWLPSRGDDYTEKLIHSRKLFAQQGIYFGLYAARVTDLYSWVLVTNINKLHALMLRRTDVLGALSPDYQQYLTHRDAMLAYVRANPEVSLDTLARAVGVTLWATWHLLIDEHVSVDLWCASLGPQTTVVDADNAPDEPRLFRRIILAMRNISWEVLCRVVTSSCRTF